VKTGVKAGKRTKLEHYSMANSEKDERSEPKSVAELLDAVPERLWAGTRFVAVADIPLPYRSAFEAWMIGQTCPEIAGFYGAVYAWDWERWKSQKLIG
jgi:hypothetical protein